jgi:iron complex transport system substrate-binding protein
MNPARNPRRRIRLLLAVLLSALAPAAASAAIELPQAGGGALTLEQPARSVVTLSPHLAELVFAAGAGDRLLATVEFSDYPEAAGRLPRVGDAYRLDLEAIVTFRPDLVIAWGSGNPAPALAQLRRLGLRVWSVEIRAPGEIADTLRQIGAATATRAVADRAADALQDRLQKLARRYADVTPLDYFYQVDARPLFTINDRHLISQGLALCGGRNIFAGEPGLAFQVAHEAVITADPAALFAPYIPGHDDPLAAWRQWPALAAVRRDALFLLPADPISRATPRWFDSLELACTLLHGLRERLNP